MDDCFRDPLAEQRRHGIPYLLHNLCASSSELEPVGEALDSGTLTRSECAVLMRVNAAIGRRMNEVDRERGARTIGV